MKAKLVTLLSVSAVLAVGSLFGDEYVGSADMVVYGTDSTEAFDTSMDTKNVPGSGDMVKMPSDVQQMAREIDTMYDKAKMAMPEGMESRFEGDPSMGKPHHKKWKQKARRMFGQMEEGRHQGRKGNAHGWMREMQQARNNFYASMNKYTSADSSAMKGNDMGNFARSMFGGERSNMGRKDRFMKDMEKFHDQFMKHYDNFQAHMKK